MKPIFLKIEPDKFNKTASRYGLDAFNILLNENEVYAMFCLSNETNDKRTIDYITNIMEHILDSSAVELDVSECAVLEYEEKYIDVYTILLSLVDYMRSKYGEKHYKEQLRQFHKDNFVEESNGIPRLHWLDDGTFMLTPVVYLDGELVFSDYCIEHKTVKTSNTRKNKRAVHRNFDWDNLYDLCELFKDFSDGEQLSHNELIHIARNVCGADKGKKVFLDIVNSNDNAQYDYAEKNWREILTGIIKGDVPISGCETCPYFDKCNHSANMLETADPKMREVRIIQMR